MERGRDGKEKREVRKSTENNFCMKKIKGVKSRRKIRKRFNYF